MNSYQIVQEPKLSPVYENLNKSDGRGFAGFTILHRDGGFENYVLFFDRNTHDEILAAVKAKHEQCSTMAKKHMLNDKIDGEPECD